MTEHQLFTVGCSNQSFERFASLLETNHIQVVVDVRSTPFSNYTPQFNQEPLKGRLKLRKLHYLYMGQEFGARRAEQSAYVEGRVCFECVFDLQAFKQGVARLEKGLARGLRLCLMCTEKDPIDCHRTIMITRFLSRHFNIPITHIHEDGHLEGNDAFESRLREVTDRQQDLFMSTEELTEQAYQVIERKIAYKVEAHAV